MDEYYSDLYDQGPDDIGYSNRNRFICTDPGCDGKDCPGEGHFAEE